MLSPSRSSPRLPPLAGDAARWFAPWFAALMIYVASLASIGLILVNETLREAETVLAGRLTVEVPAQVPAARLQTALAVLRQTQGIRSVHLLSAEETGRLLEPWLGSSVPLAELPIPRLIDVGLDPAGVDMANLKTRLETVVPDIRLDDYHPVAGGLRAGARSVQALLGATIGGALLLVAALGALATRTALAARRSDVELLHPVGADDRQITRQIARRYAARALLYGLIGGGIAAAAVAATVVAFGDAGRLIRPAAPVAGIGLGDWRLWAVLAAMAAASGIVAAASARATARWRLSRLP